jgi:cobalt-zinc-cadmium efflux system outer membrane protein
MKEGIAMRLGWLSLGAVLLVAAGCTFPVREAADSLVCHHAEKLRDAETLLPPTRGKVTLGVDVNNGRALSGEEASEFQEQPTSPPKGPTTLEKRLTVPETVPGSEAKVIGVPFKGQKDYPQVIDAVIQEHFPPLSPLQHDIDFPPGPEGWPLTLSDLHHIALTNSPLIRQAAFDIEAARGAAIQAGAYPNPTVGYEASGVGPSGGPNYGMFVTQTIKTMGKLKLAQAAALMDVRAAELAYRRAETDLMSNVRTYYYQVLVAQESIRANRGLVQLTDEVYRVMVDQLRGGEVATYEPLQLAVYSEQARASLVQARNSRRLAWKQLAAALGLPNIPPTAVAGDPHRATPALDFEKALAHVLSHHTDVLTTASTIEKARHNLRLAQVTPVPDFNIQVGAVNDLGSAGPSRLVTNVQVSVPVPVFDRNKGAIQQSQATLGKAIEEPHRVQADLTSRFSEAYRRHEENRVLLAMYQKNILPKQVQTFRAAVKRHFGGDIGGVAFNDLVSSEQNLVQVIGSYLTILQGHWQAVVDVASFLQTDELFRMADEVSGSPTVDFDELLRLPCHHPCSPTVPASSREGLATQPAVQGASHGAPQLSPPTLAISNRMDNQR